MGEAESTGTGEGQGNRTAYTCGARTHKHPHSPNTNAALTAIREAMSGLMVCWVGLRGHKTITVNQDC